MDTIQVRSLLEDKSYFHEPFRLVTLQATETVENTLRKLQGHKILSAPVEFRSAPDTSVLMIVDVSDLARALAHDPSNLHKSLYDVAAQLDIGMKTVGRVTVDNSLADVVRQMVTTGAHRVVALDYEPPMGTAVGVLSQMDVTRWADKNDMRLHQIHVSQAMRKSPVCIHENEPVTKAISLCVDNRYGGVGVLDDAGALKGNFSISDLRILNPENFQHLLKHTVKRFMEETKGELMKLPVSVHPDETLHSAVHKMIQSHIHRVYVLDAQGRPVGVVSTSDVVQHVHAGLGSA